MGVIYFSMVTNHKQTCIIHFVDCRKALHSYFTHHTRKYFGCERRRWLHGGRHVVARVDVLGTTCATGGPLGLASGKLPSAHIASYEKGRCCQAPPCGETALLGLCAGKSLVTGESPHKGPVTRALVFL